MHNTGMIIYNYNSRVSKPILMIHQPLFEQFKHNIYYSHDHTVTLLYSDRIRRIHDCV